MYRSRIGQLVELLIASLGLSGNGAFLLAGLHQTGSSSSGAGALDPGPAPR